MDKIEQYLIDQIEICGNDMTKEGEKHVFECILQKVKEQQLLIQGVVESALTTKDLIAFAKWINDKFYSHRLQFLPIDLEIYYIQNRESILKRYS